MANGKDQKEEKFENKCWPDSGKGPVVTGMESGPVLL